VKAIPVLLAALAVSACVGIMPKRASRPEIGGMTDGRKLPASAVGSASAGITSKAVYSKREPITLVSRGQTECIVSEAKYRETNVGDKVRCEWRAQ
jgi:hypothetical protein